MNASASSFASSLLNMAAIQPLIDRWVGNSPSTTRRRSSKLRHLAACYHWATFLFILAMVSAQFLSVVWDSTTKSTPIVFGWSPTSGPKQVIGENDVPYDDRVIVCVRKPDSTGVYEPWQVSELFAANKTRLVDPTGTSKTGYRLVNRDPAITPLILNEQAIEIYYRACSLIADTIDNIVNACSKLGYTNITTDMMRVVPDTDSDDLHEIPDSLPLLIMPYWDNAPSAREAMPTWDGDACIFRLEEAYMSDLPIPRFRGVNQSVRHDRTIEWLNVRSTGEWRNGWYEDPTGMRWYSDVVSSYDDPVYHIMHRQFDMRTGKEEDCYNTDVCRAIPPFLSYWGSQAYTTTVAKDFISIAASNGSHYGIFRFKATIVRTVRCLYDWETLLSNATVALLLTRWMFAMLTLHRSFYHCKSDWHSGSISCIANAKSFNMLPLTVLPHLKRLLDVFWTVGCQFEGQQAALSESWFAIYPAVVEVMLVYYSLLNTLAMVLRRRMSDMLFAPSIIVLCLLHYFRYSLAESGLLRGVDGRVSTVVNSDEASTVRLIDYFSSDLAIRINGNVLEIFVFKLAVLGSSLLLLVFSNRLPCAGRNQSKVFSGIEKALAIRAAHAGGLASINVLPSTFRNLPELRGVVLPNPWSNSVSDADNRSGHPGFMSGYELIRLGYVIFGNKFLIKFEDWETIILIAPLRNYRVLVWLVSDERMKNGFEGKTLNSEYPEIWRVDDPRLKGVPWWHISACDVSC